MLTTRRQERGRRNAAGLAGTVFLSFLLAGAHGGTAVQADPPPVVVDKLPEQRQAALDLAQKDPGFAGTWFDASSSELVMAYTASDNARDKAVAALLPSELRDRLATRVVARSLKDLAADKAKLLRDGVATGAALDVAGNGLLAVVPDEGARRDILARQAAGGPSLTVLVGRDVDDTCTSRYSCGGANHRRGGVKIENSSSGSCTSGLSVVRGGTRYSTTAGHCWYGSTAGALTSGGQSFGALNSTTAYYSGGWCDCRLVTTTSGVAVGAGVYWGDATPYYEFTAKRSESSVGDTVRLIGQNTQSSGTVSYINYEYTGPMCNCTMHGGVLANYSRAPGDSGGAVTSTGGTTAVGMHSGEIAGYGRFTEVSNIEVYLGVTILV